MKRLLLEDIEFCFDCPYEFYDKYQGSCCNAPGGGPNQLKVKEHHIDPACPLPDAGSEEDQLVKQLCDALMDIFMTHSPEPLASSHDYLCWARRRAREALDGAQLGIIIPGIGVPEPRTRAEVEKEKRERKEEGFRKVRCPRCGDIGRVPIGGRIVVVCGKCGFPIDV